MILIGLTGGIGAGKSTVSELWERRGAVVVDADRITRELQEPGTPVFEAMVEHFGPEIVAEDGRLDRPAVARLAFSDPEQLRALNAIVHPAVGAEIARRLEELSTTDALVVLDVPLLVESGRSDLHALVVVDVEEDEAVDRLVRHRGMDEADARARMRHQAARSDRLARADLVIVNDGTLEDLRARADEAFEWMRSRARP